MTGLEWFYVGATAFYSGMSLVGIGLCVVAFIMYTKNNRG